MWAPALDFGLGARFGLLRVALLALFSAALVALGAWAGYSLGRAPLLVDLAELRQAHAETAKLAALAAASGLQQAQQRGNVLTQTLATAQVQIDELQTEKRHAINRFTTGRACLGADAVGVLNSASPPTGIGGFADVPAAPGGVAATGTGFATDADVGQWAIAARAAHDECSARLDALIDWHALPNKAFEPRRLSHED